MKIQLLLILALFLAFSFDANAVTTVTNSDATISLTGENHTTFKKSNKVTTWFKKQKTKAVSWLVKKAMAIDWQDDRMILKLWIIGIVGGIVLTILATVLAVITQSALLGTLLWALASLLYLAGVILFWYWIYIKFIA